MPIDLTGLDRCTDGLLETVRNSALSRRTGCTTVSTMTDGPARPGTTGTPLRVAFVPGVTPGKWSRTWAQRLPEDQLELLPVEEEDQLEVLRDGRADMSFVRLPVERDGLNLIPLYREVPVVVVPLDHPATVLDEVTLDDLADEHLLQTPAITMRQAFETVAAGTGIVIVPKSVARLHNRKDVVAVPVAGMPESQIGLAWPTDATDTRIETFIGIVRGRTERSSRDAAPAVPQKNAAPQKGKAPKPRSERSAGSRSQSGRGGASGRPRGR